MGQRKMMQKRQTQAPDTLAQPAETKDADRLRALEENDPELPVLLALSLSKFCARARKIRVLTTRQ